MVRSQQAESELRGNFENASLTNSRTQKSRISREAARHISRRKQRVTRKKLTFQLPTATLCRTLQKKYADVGILYVRREQTMNIREDLQRYLIETDQVVQSRRYKIGFLFLKQRFQFG